MTRTTQLIILALVLVLMPFILGADNIYTWKDENGISKFSNTPPPEDVTDYKITKSVASENPFSASENKRRSSYDEMAERASSETKAAQAQRKKAEEAKKAEQNRALMEKQKAHRLAERKRLESKIEAIRKRAVSPTYPNGMKQAQIDAIVKQIKNLDDQSK